MPPRVMPDADASYGPDEPKPAKRRALSGVSKTTGWTFVVGWCALVALFACVRELSRRYDERSQPEGGL